MYSDESYYVFIEHEEDEVIEKFIIRIFQNSTWHIESIKGLVPYDLENETFDREDVIDDIMDYLRDTYDYVQEINFSDIDDYMIDEDQEDDEE
jgi:hypothetical protein